MNLRARAWRNAAVAYALYAVSGAGHAILSINEPWVRASPDGRTADVFVKLKSSDGAMVADADTFAAKRIEIRDDATRRPLKSIELPANSLVEMKPGGTHLRMTGLVRRLKHGEHVPITLIVRSADGTSQKLYMNAEVRHRSPSEDELDPRGHHHTPAKK